MRRPALERRVSTLYALLIFAALPLAGLLLANKADPDLWMHLRAGRLMLETRDVPRADVFSFAAAGRPWVSHEWLFQLLAYAVFAVFGARGLMAVKALVGAATLACVYGAAEERTASRAARALVFLAAGAPLVLLGSTCRPQLVTFLGCAFVVYLHARERGRGASAALDFAPVLLLPWSWLHGGFLAGAAAFILIAAGEAAAGRRRVRLLAVLAAASAATALNPYGLALWGRLARTLAHPALGGAVLEWKPVWSCGEPLYQALFVLQALLLAAAAVGGAAREEAADWLLAGAGLAAALVSARHLLLAALFGVPALAAAAERRRRRAGLSAPPPRAALAGFGAAALVLLAGLASAVVDYRISGGAPVGALVYGEPGPAWVVYPKGAVEFLRAGRVRGRLWSDANVGGYLIWHLYPECRVFLDPRFEHVYTPEEMSDYSAAMAAARGWPRVLEKYAPDLLLLPSGAPLAAAASAARAWRPIYRDPDFLLLARAVPAYRGLIEAFAADPRPAPRPPWPWLFP